MLQFLHFWCNKPSKKGY